MVAVMALSTSAFAQQAGPRGGGGKPEGGREGRQGGGMRMMKIEDEIFAKLNLTAQQKTQINKLREDRRKAVEGLRAKNLQREQIRPEMQKITTNYREGLKKILNPAQEKQYQELWKAAVEKMRKERGGQGRPGGRPGGPGQGKPGQGGAKP